MKSNSNFSNITFNTGGYGDSKHSLFNTIKDEILIDNIKNNILYKFLLHIESFLTKNKFELEVKKISKILNLNIIFQDYERDNFCSFILYSQNTILDLSLQDYGLYITGFTANKDIIEKLEKYKKDNEIKSNDINIIKFSNNRLELKSLGQVHWPDLIIENYHPFVIEKYQHLLNDFNNTKPLGRLSIIDGPPGTGKTHLVKSLIQKATVGKFILIPTDEFAKINSSQFIDFLCDEAKNQKQTLVLIIEDADDCLVHRKDNNSNISALLNFTDGIIGSLLDIRVICTTNAKKIEIDSALLRLGRLNIKIEVNHLPADQANKILLREFPKANKKFTLPTTLAEIYAAVLEHKNYGNCNKEKIGF